MKNLVDEAEKELEEEKVELAKDIIKERIKEIKYAEKVLLKLKNKYEDLLGKDIDEVVDDEC